MEEIKFSPHSDAVLGVVKAVDGSEDMRERVLRVAAHQRKQHAWSHQRRLGVPAFLREITPTQGENEQRRGGGEQQRAPVHGETLHHRSNQNRHRHRLNLPLSLPRYSARDIKVTPKSRCRSSTHAHSQKQTLKRLFNIFRLVY